jgi:hypothetical protein
MPLVEGEVKRLEAKAGDGRIKLKIDESPTYLWVEE